MKIKHLFFLVITMSISSVFAQNAIVSSGNSVSDTGGSLSYSVGQISYMYFSTNSGSVSEGVQQVGIENIENAIDQIIQDSICVTVFPNPFVDEIIIDFKGRIEPNVIFEFYNSTGVLIETDSIDGVQSKVNCKNLSSGTYYLKVFSNDKIIKTFKMIKN